MTETASNELIYALLKNMQGEFSLMRRDISELKLRMQAVKEHVGTIVMSLAGVNNRLDHHVERLDRIDKRLGLIDA
jgi:hypothetical protein